MSKIFNLFFLLFALSLFSCEFPTQESLIEESKGALWAVPLLKDEIKIQDIFVDDNDGVSVFSDTEGKVIVTYEGEVLRDPASVVFPPIPGIIPIPLIDTIFELDLTMGGGTLNEIDSAVFLRDFLHFRIKSSSTTPFVVTGWIDEINKDGSKFVQTIGFPGSPTGVELEFAGEEVKLEGWNLIGNDNKVTFHYKALDLSGEPVDNVEVEVFFNILEFSYVQGYFPKTIRPVTGSFIPINLYSRWLSGTMDFVEPKVTMDVENSFGFAVGAEFQQMSIETIDGMELAMESDIITNGIIFEYPELDEIDVIKNTNFDFNKDNSNIAIIFNDRVAKFNYTIDAVANPLNEPDFLGFMTNNSFYAVQVKVEVPMHLAIKDLQLVDTLDLNFDVTNEYLDTAELKVILENNFPIDVSAQLYMLDANNNIIDSIFQEGEKFLKGGTYVDGGVLQDIDEQTYFVEFSEDKIDNLLKSKRILVKPTFISTPNGEDKIWIYDNYNLQIKMGAKFSLK
ncbi:hypothetical protein N9B82_03055 [Saprospiraceae bacterium]|nr:hypothetical protein [Saprospiraceae bacterium]